MVIKLFLKMSWFLEIICLECENLRENYKGRKKYKKIGANPMSFLD
jgi:hypothetical protein